MRLSLIYRLQVETMLLLVRPEFFMKFNTSVPHTTLWLTHRSLNKEYVAYVAWERVCNKLMANMWWNHEFEVWGGPQRFNQNRITLYLFIILFSSIPYSLRWHSRMHSIRFVQHLRVHIWQRYLNDKFGLVLYNIMHQNK